MSRQCQTAPPTFFWQGLLILLPVTVLAVLGLLSVRQDRRLAEQEARERAEQIIRQLSTVIGQNMGGRLARFEIFANSRHSAYLMRLAAWPQTEMARQWQVAQTNYYQEQAAWSAAYPGLMLDRDLFVVALPQSA